MNDDPDWQAVFWDVGGVILSLESVQHAHATFVEELCDRYPCRGDADDALERWRTVVGEYFAERDELAFRPARDGYDRAVAAILETNVSREEWRPLFQDVMDRLIRPNPEAVETVRTLQASDRHVGVISDVDHEEGEWILERFGLLAGFDSYTSSEAVGWTKPHPAMFETALATAGVPADRSLMIGDRYRNDMEGATNVGMATVAFGAEDGPAVDYRISRLSAVLEVVNGERPEA
ncbi:MAG: HAD family hydrolase [Halobacteriota archaeon]